MNSQNDWVRLRTHAYGDMILKLFDVRNNCRFGKQVICAGLYEKGIRVLLGQEDSVHHLGRHLEAPKTVV